MNKDNFLYGIIGLLAGLIIGYAATTAINRSSPIVAQKPAGTAAPSASVPADHPPMGGEGAAAGGMRGDIAATLEKARTSPTDFDAQMKAGALYYQVKRYPQALEHFERAQKVKPNEFEVLVSLGNVTFDLQRYQEAAGWYDKALKLRPNDVNLRTDLGLSYYLREPKDLDRAIASYRASLGYDPRHEQTLQNLITALIDKGDLAGARNYLSQLERVNSNNAALPQFRARLSSQ